MYTEIVEIVAPSSAVAGETVNIVAKVRNLHASAINILVSGRYDTIDVLYFSPSQAWVSAGETYSFPASFVMPSQDITVTVYSFYMGEYGWYLDDTKQVNIAVPPPEAYHLDIYVPAWAYGGYIEPGSGDYPAHSMVTLKAHPFSGYKFTAWGVDASGTDPTYNLYMDSDKYVEAYFEKVPVPESEFRGFALSEYTKR
ncbi:hypothetical protein ES703_121899 [subsurface metagenome]